MSPEVSGSSRSMTGTAVPSTRPSTGWSHDSSAPARPSSESTPHNRRDSSTTYGSNFAAQDSRRFSGLFHSALPPAEGPDESRLSSRASSRERGPVADGYNVLWLAASLFEFNISTTKHEAGYPYLIYQAGEVSGVY
jgi:dynamin-binding protein